MTINFDAWTTATSKLPWGAQRVFRDTLQAVADEQVNLAYGADYKDGSPCLVNATAAMLTTGGGHGIPSAHFSDVVAQFDSINRALSNSGVNTEYGKVSPLAAEILLQNFAALKEQPIKDKVNEATKNEAFAQGTYREPQDEELMQDWMKAMSEPCAAEFETPTTTDQTTEQEADHGTANRTSDSR